jgi:predicted ABC-type ATPase
VSTSVPPFASLRAAAADERPVLVVLAGPNGAGKSTFFAEHLHGLGLLFVNADHIARLLRDAEPRLSTRELEQRALEEAERLRADLIDLRFAFCTETVFSDPAGAKLDFMQRARAAGFVVLLVFIGLASPVLSVARVATRVARGGHDIPNDKLFARYPRTLKNLRAAVTVVDRAFVFDNSSVGTPFRPVAMYEDGRVTERFPPLPRWTRGLPGL